MKNTKNLIVIFLVIIFALSFNISYAHSVDLDPQSLISFPMIAWGGKGSVTISSSVTDYSLYYQAVAIPNANYTQMVTIREEGELELDTLDSEYDALKVELENLETIYDEALENYNANQEDENLKNAYEEAKSNYEAKLAQYKAKATEYNTKVQEINNAIKELIPEYVESNWNQATDNEFVIDLTTFSGTQAFAVWVKLVETDETIHYDEMIYEVEGTKTEKVKVTSVSLSKDEISITEGSTYTLNATVSPSDATNKSVTWKSDNENVATVENGKVTAVSKGTATITVTTVDGNFTDSCVVTVTEKTPPKGDDQSNGNNELNPNNGQSSGTNNKGNTTDSVYDGKLPQTGISYIAIFTAITVLIAIVIILHKKIQNLSFK